MLEAIWMPNNKHKMPQVLFWLLLTYFGSGLGFGFGCDLIMLIINLPSAMAFCMLSVELCPSNKFRLVVGSINKLLNSSRPTEAGINLILALSLCVCLVMRRTTRRMRNGNIINALNSAASLESATILRSWRINMRTICLPFEHFPFG